MNEKGYFRFVVMFVIIAIICGGAIGFLIGRGNSVRPVEPERADRELAATTGELRTEFQREGAITERIGIKQAEERVLIENALDACRRTGDGIQGVIAKMEILNGLIRELERRADGGADLSAGE